MILFVSCISQLQIPLSVVDHATEEFAESCSDHSAAPVMHYGRLGPSCHRYVVTVLISAHAICKFIALKEFENMVKGLKQ